MKWCSRVGLNTTPRGATLKLGTLVRFVPNRVLSIADDNEHY